MKFDIPAVVASGGVDTYVYSVRYGRNDCLAQALNQLFNPGRAWARYGRRRECPGCGLPSAAPTTMATERADRARMPERTAAAQVTVPAVSAAMGGMGDYGGGGKHVWSRQ